MEGDGLNALLEAGGQGSIEKLCALDGLADTKENLSVLSEFHGNYSLGNLRGMGGRERDSPGIKIR